MRVGARRLSSIIPSSSEFPVGTAAARAIAEATLGTSMIVVLEQDSSSQRKKMKPKKGRGLRWIEAGAVGALPAEMRFGNAHGKLSVLNAAGPIEMKGHPFFEPLGLNSRACVTCHQPANAMSVSVETLRERWRVRSTRTRHSCVAW